MSCSSNVKAPLVVNFVFSIFIPYLLVLHSSLIRQMQSLSTNISPTSWGFICCSVAECTLVRVKDVGQQGARFLRIIQRVVLGHLEFVHHQDIPLMQQMPATIMTMISCHQTDREAMDHHNSTRIGPRRIGTMMKIISCQGPLHALPARRRILKISQHGVQLFPGPSLHYVSHRCTHHLEIQASTVPGTPNGRRMFRLCLY